MNYGSVTAGYNSDELSEVVCRVATRANTTSTNPGGPTTPFAAALKAFSPDPRPAVPGEAGAGRVRAVHAVFARRSVRPQTKVLCRQGNFSARSEPDSHHLGQLNVFSP